MTEKEREFKIKMIKKYDEELDNQKTFSKSLGVFIGSVCIAAGFVSLLNYHLVWAAITLLVGSLNITVYAKELVAILAKKAGMEMETERLKDDIAIDIINNSDEYSQNNKWDYKINKITKYKDEISKQKSTLESLIIFGSALMIAFGISIFTHDYYIGGLLEILGGSAINAAFTKDLIEKLAKKAGLEREVQRLQNELEMDNLNNYENYVNGEQRGRSR